MHAKYEPYLAKHVKEPQIHVSFKFEVTMFNTSWTIDIRMNIQIWLLYRRYKSGWYIFGLATILLIAACACKVWTLFGQACERALDTCFW